MNTGRLDKKAGFITYILKKLRPKRNNFLTEIYGLILWKKNYYTYAILFLRNALIII